MRIVPFVLIVLGVPVVASGHVTVQPRESQAGAVQQYTVRVPTEGQVSTTSVELEVPPGVTITEVQVPTTGSDETKKEGDRIVAVIWTCEIKPREAARFTFTAQNPRDGVELVWKAHQRFADGSMRSWAQAPGSRNPASVTKLLPTDRSRCIGARVTLSPDRLRDGGCSSGSNVRRKRFSHRFEFASVDPT